MVQLQPQELDSIKHRIHFMLGSGDAESIITALSSEHPGMTVTSSKSYLERGDVPRTLSTPPHYAYLKIAEGCRKHCSYCIIPTIKGSLKSKPESQIIKEFHTLYQRGVREFILVAQDLGDWGKDLGYVGSTGLVHILKQLLKIPQNFCIRLLYVYPDEISHELVEVMSSDHRILPYLDMPIQHCNDSILQAMRRSTSKSQIIECIRMLRQAIPHIALRTSVIVGFPGETAAHHKELCSFIKDMEFTHLGIFGYSREELSASYSLPDQVDEKTIQDRCQKLSNIQKKIVEKRHKTLIGTQQKVTVDGYHPETKLLMTGRLETQCPEVDSCVIINEHDKVTAFGEQYLVTITDATGYDLVARVLEPL
jgi:ribosomal protein S12 methylthiotransferase